MSSFDKVALGLLFADADLERGSRYVHVIHISAVGARVWAVGSAFCVFQRGLWLHPLCRRRDVGMDTSNVKFQPRVDKEKKVSRLRAGQVRERRCF